MTLNIYWRVYAYFYCSDAIGRIHVHACPGEVSYIEFQSRPRIRFEVLLIRMAIEYEDRQIMEICKTLSKGFYPPYLHKMIKLYMTC